MVENLAAVSSGHFITRALGELLPFGENFARVGDLSELRINLSEEKGTLGVFGP